MDYAFKPILLGGRAAVDGGRYLLLFFLSIFLEASILLLFLASITHFLFHFFKEVFHLLGRTTLLETAVGLRVGAILLLILFLIAQHV